MEAARSLEAVRAALAADGAALLDDQERDLVQITMRTLETATASDDHVAIKHAISELGRVTEPFAARRMDRSVAQALTGKRIEEVKAG